MTVIAWDGKTLAADKQCTIADLRRTVTKVHRVGKCLVATTGSTAQGQEMVQWVRSGCKPESFPESQRDKDDWAATVVVRAGPVLDLYERTPYPTRYEDKQFAIGSGRDYAIAAMYLGKCAVDAVKIASEFDVHSGMGVDVLELK